MILESILPYLCIYLGVMLGVYPVLWILMGAGFLTVDSTMAFFSLTSFTAIAYTFGKVLLLLRTRPRPRGSHDT